MSKERELLKRVISGTDDGVDFFIGYRLYKDIETFLDQPEQTEQEPEAWMLIDKETGARIPRAYKPEHGVNQDRWKLYPLYTAPPKRESLTPRQGLEEYKKGYARAEIDLKREPLGLEIMDACGSEDYREGFKDGALYAEKAHGIGGVE